MTLCIVFTEANEGNQDLKLGKERNSSSFFAVLGGLL